MEAHYKVYFKVSETDVTPPATADPLANNFYIDSIKVDLVYGEKSTSSCSSDVYTLKTSLTWLTEDESAR